MGAYTPSDHFYKERMSQLIKLIYLVYTVDEIHQFLLTNLFLIKRTGGSTKDSRLVPIYTVGYTNSILNQDQIKIITIKL